MTTATGDPATTAVTTPQIERHGAPLFVAMLGFFVVALDAQIVNVALPDIGAGLGGGLSGLQWVVTAYTLTFSSLLLFAGTLADRIGARRTYGAGMALFVISSAVCGAAPSLTVLIAARVVQGIGAAMVTPTSLAMLRAAYADARRRAQAVAYWALGGSVAAAAGPVLGGLMTQWYWRVIFLVNLPVGTFALTLLTRVKDSSTQRHPFDLVGQLAALRASVPDRGWPAADGGRPGGACPDPGRSAPVGRRRIHGAGSFTVPPLTSLLLDAVPGGRAGTASGVLNTARQVGGSMGVAVSGAVIAHQTGFMTGLCTSLLAVAVLVVVTTSLGVALPSARQENSR